MCVWRDVGRRKLKRFLVPLSIQFRPLAACRLFTCSSNPKFATLCPLSSFLSSSSSLFLSSFSSVASSSIHRLFLCPTSPEYRARCWKRRRSFRPPSTTPRPVIHFQHLEKREGLETSISIGANNLNSASRIEYRVSTTVRTQQLSWKIILVFEKSSYQSITKNQHPKKQI